ncbi:site-specific DNA-methyltransferase [Flavobacterium psychrotolerans]|uniref:site-specific DNA-methyltransferase (adenine-specific) n=1 Tax=Flavobacterium psychrotolerans TaxID=2169410 RepID=A0A2U1JKK2_9FLAO|nr:site-specific DNA-methyltransferase [Flavobacterium psychrotolerans]PWA05686.1 site-specific DNA-methyltransferase [Flavobacterium psychrotolerans]
MSKNKLQKLELTWIGKGDEPKLEPRILIENPEYSYGDPTTDNILIHGDNLLGLKALEQDFAGKVKCIYIDPPYNTGNAFEHYDDGIEHSLWLNLIYNRLSILKNLLSKDGCIFIQLDDNELDYCKIICDELFGRDNLINRIAIDVRAPSAFSTVNPGVFKASEYLLFYAKDKSNFQEVSARVIREPDYAYSLWLQNPSDDFQDWKFENVLNAYRRNNNDRESTHPRKSLDNYNKFIVSNSARIARLASISDTGAGQQVIELKKQSQSNRDKIFKLERKAGLDDVYVLNGQQLIFYKKNVIEIDGEQQASKLLTNIWSDIAWEGIANEGGVVFKRSKKPERLIKRILELTTKEGDLILDSFLGSGTTAAVAHKMNRKYIGIELGEHAKTHCYPRLKAVIDGEQGGISKTVNWQGGGGFKFYTLAPSLLKQDKFGNWVISQEYNPDMLAAAMAKQEGFNYLPNEDKFWKQGNSSENDFIFTTTQFLTVETLDSIHDDMQEGESILICCKAFQKECKSKYPNITLKKIPQMLLDRCEFGKDDYSLNIVNLPTEEAANLDSEEENVIDNESVQEIRDNKETVNQGTLFE